MINSISYQDNPAHYKRLINKINEEVDFASYLARQGYTLLKKSAGSMEFVLDTDRIVLITSRNPVSYFNRNNSEDKGLFFRFLRNRETNFYQTVKSGLGIINSNYAFDVQSRKKPKKADKKKSLEDNYNISPLSNPIFLVKERNIDISTLNSTFFKGSIFNAFHCNDNGGKIANVAFPKFDLQGTPQNYILYNRPYKDRNTGENRKFRLVLNKKDHFLFHSNFPKQGVKRVVFGESGIDLLSFNELQGKKGDFYVSFGGNVYNGKLDFFYALINPVLIQKNIELVSIMDNDLSGYEYDLKVFSKLINELNPDVFFENSIKQGYVTIKIHYNSHLRNLISRDNQRIEKSFKTRFPKIKDVQNIEFVDKLLLEFPLAELLKRQVGFQDCTNALKELLLTLNGIYLPIQSNILKSTGKDWNQDLQESKKKKVNSKNLIKL